MLKNKIALTIVLIFSVLLLVGMSPKPYSLNYDTVTGILIGEGGHSTTQLELLACTVQNRLNAGWSDKYVMSAYYAKYQQPVKEEIELVKHTILHGECLPVYFAFGDGDKYNRNVPPIVSFGGISYFSKDQYRQLVTSN